MEANYSENGDKPIRTYATREHGDLIALDVGLYTEEYLTPFIMAYWDIVKYSISEARPSYSGPLFNNQGITRVIISDMEHRWSFAFVSCPSLGGYQCG